MNIPHLKSFWPVTLGRIQSLYCPPVDMRALRDACRFEFSDDHLELFKTTKKYDGDLGDAPYDG
jgi:hypothetical protein